MSDAAPSPGWPSRNASAVLGSGGVVIAHLPNLAKTFLGSPSIAVRPDGALVVSFDVFGDDSSCNRTFVAESIDAGRTWQPIAQVTGAFWCTLFHHGRELYLLGCSTEYGNLVIRRSGDGGHTWSTPTGPRDGLLRSDARFHTAAVPVVTHAGRIWRAVEVTLADGGEWGRFAASVTSAATDADLLDASSWSLTPPVDVPLELREQGCPTWLEGNVVPTPDGGLVTVLRAETWTRGRQFAATLTVNGAQEPLGVDPVGCLHPMPGGGSKFTIRFDPVSRGYIALVNTALHDSSPTHGLRARNTLALARSDDARQWHVLDVVAHHPDDARHAFQYADWVVHGNDLLAAVRTAAEFDGMQAASYHDSNLVTFHRVEDFRRIGA